jgi:hypothetical protein
MPCLGEAQRDPEAFGARPPDHRDVHDAKPSG